MANEYKVNVIFNEEGLTFNEIVNMFLISFLDNEFNNNVSDGIMGTDIISGL